MTCRLKYHFWPYPGMPPLPDTIMELLLTPWLGMPAWAWLAFIGVVIALLVFDLGVMHREAHEIGVRESLWMSALYIGLGLAWSVAVYHLYMRYSGQNSVDPQIAAPCD